MQAILGPPLASLGERMAAPAHGPKTGKDGRETGKEKPRAAMRGACDGLALFGHSFPSALRIAAVAYSDISPPR
jgi:hypothetical protein